MTHRHPLRTLCLALAGAGLLGPALAQDAAGTAAHARQALGLDNAAAAAAPVPGWALGLQPDAAPRPAAPRRAEPDASVRAAPARAATEATPHAATEPAVRTALGLAGESEPAPEVESAPRQPEAQHHEPQHRHETQTLPASAGDYAALLVALAPAELAPALPAAAPPPLAPVPDSPLPAPHDLRDAPLLAETRMNFAPLLAAVPFIDTPPDGDGDPEAGHDVAQADASQADAPGPLAAPLPTEPSMTFAPLLAAVPFIDTSPSDAGEREVGQGVARASPDVDFDPTQPLPGHIPATAQAVGVSGPVEFAALDDTRMLAAAQSVATIDTSSSPQVERVLSTLADVTGLHDLQPMLRELPIAPMAPISAVDRVLADLADVTQRWALAQEAWLDDQRPNTMGEGWERVARSELDVTRGGFLAPNGLRISFGIERAVYINGNLVATTRLTVSELGAITGTGVGSNGAPGMALIQNGALGTVTGTIAPGAVGTVIQNALNGQQIQNTTVINATVNSLDVMRSMNLQSTIRNAVSDSLRR